jgi:hypothetical protein
MLLKRIHTRRREKDGDFHKLCEELKSFPHRYFQYFCMTKEQFEILHSLIENKITKEDTNYRKSISTRQRLCSV